MSRKRLRPGALDEIASMIDAKSDRDLAAFLGITERQLEHMRYGDGVTVIQAADIIRRRDAHIKAAELLTPDAA